MGAMARDTIHSQYSPYSASTFRTIRETKKINKESSMVYYGETFMGVSAFPRAEHKVHRNTRTVSYDFSGGTSSQNGRSTQPVDFYGRGMELKVGNG